MAVPARAYRVLSLICVLVLLASAAATAVGAARLEDTPAASPGELAAEAAVVGSRSESLAPQARNPVVVLTDDEGDTSLLGTVPTPPAGVEDAHVDIISLTLLETDEAILFQLRHRGYPEPQTMASILFGAGGIEYICRIGFRHDGSGTSYDINIRSNYNPTSIYALRGSLYSTGFVADLPAALVAEERLEALLPKSLIGEGRSPGLFAGSSLVDFEVSCAHYDGLWFDISDDAAAGSGDPNSYTPEVTPHHRDFGAQFAALTQVLSHSSGSAPRDPNYARAPLGIPPGEMRDARVILKAHELDVRTVFAASAMIVDEQGYEQEDWTVQMPGGARLEPEDQLSLPVLVSLPADAAHGDWNFLKITFTREDDSVTVVRPVRALVDPGPGRNTLYFHGSGAEGIVMNLHENDPSRSQGTAASAKLLVLASGMFVEAEQEDPFTSARNLRGEEPVLVTLFFSADAETERWIDLGLGVSGSGGLGWGYDRVEIGTSPTPVRFTIYPDTFAFPFSPGSQIWLEMYVSSPNLGPLIGGVGVDEVRWHMEGSKIELPFAPERRVADTSLVRLEVADGPPYFITAQGHRQAIALRATNPYDEPVELKLDQSDSPADWRFRFMPDANLRLGPGEERAVCVEVVAPRELSEDVMTLAVGAAGPEEERLARLPLTFYVAQGAILEGSRCAAQGHVQSEAELEPGDRSLPGPGIASLVLLVAGVVLLRRRRQVSNCFT